MSDETLLEQALAAIKAKQYDQAQTLAMQMPKKDADRVHNEILRLIALGKY